MQFQFSLNFQDLWVGAVWISSQRALHICPFPAMVFRIGFARPVLHQCPTCSAKMLKHCSKAQTAPISAASIVPTPLLAAAASTENLASRNLPPNTARTSTVTGNPIPSLPKWRPGARMTRSSTIGIDATKPWKSFLFARVRKVDCPGDTESATLRIWTPPHPRARLYGAEIMAAIMAQGRATAIVVERVSTTSVNVSHRCQAHVPRPMEPWHPRSSPEAAALERTTKRQR